MNRTRSKPPGQHPDAVAGIGIDDVVEHYAALISQLPSPPVLIGHSFGGMIAEKLLGQNLASAAIAIDAAQIKGVLPLPLSALRSTLPVFKNPANRHRSVSLTADRISLRIRQRHTARGIQRALGPMGGTVTGQTAVRGCRRELLTAFSGARRHRQRSRGPLLLMMGGADHTVPEAITKATQKQYRHSQAQTDLMEFADRGHSLAVDHGWPDIAAACLSWLQANLVPGDSPTSTVSAPADR